MFFAYCVKTPKDTHRFATFDEAVVVAKRAAIKYKIPIKIECKEQVTKLNDNEFVVTA